MQELLAASCEATGYRLPCDFLRFFGEPFQKFNHGASEQGHGINVRRKCLSQSGRCTPAMVVGDLLCMLCSW